ncbi:LysR family transcriptional regulator [Shewanella sp. JM162201]|uniref:LysR family transcriptional regulator n=1 Tax=Shewanella jiangmenensis TaxID=2837387 RepID=A0ABS5V0N5_9GAMM|nr:LysR family transcriptional regulator [Shewanella jiangmenensis]MBT1444036.1 LysR family transcriptional regulator [Shewanella jiangmenensis]
MDLNRVQLFAAVVEQGSFTAAATHLGVTKATVSRKVAELEQEAGVQLLFRTTRALKLTEAGSNYYQRISRILSELQQAEAQLSASQQQIRGRLSIVCPIELGQLYLGRVLTQFLLEYPQITIETELTNRRVDVIEEGIDMLFQIAEVKDPRLTSHALIRAEKILLASPDYLARFGTPNVPADLAQHKAIRLTSAHIDGSWRIFDGEQWQSFDPPAQLTVNNVTLAREAAIEGLGIATVPTLIARDAIDAGLLVPVLEDFPMQQSRITLSYPQGAYLPRRYRVFIEFLFRHLMERFGDEVLEVPDFINS